VNNDNDDSHNINLAGLSMWHAQETFSGRMCV